MSRQKLNKPYFRRKGNFIDGRKRYVLEKEIAGQIYSIALNPDKLWNLLSKKKDCNQTKQFVEGNPN